MTLSPPDPAVHPPLTGFSHGAGCGCKLSAGELRRVLGAMARPFPTHLDVLVGPGGADDAGVFRLDASTALVQTIDFFTPVVDDARDWGAIAAANALSDVYAMGGRPLTALNIVAWPRDRLPWATLARVLDGAAGVLEGAGCALVGGHSIDDAEPKFGLSVTGLVDPAALLTNDAGRPGDLLVLTKPLGTGVVTTAAKHGTCPDEVLAAAVASMTRLNATAARLALAHGARCATDVTGFGLLGHLGEVVAASGTGAAVDAGALPLLPGVEALVAAGAIAGGTRRNSEDAHHVVWQGRVDEVLRWLACDAQTSGGLLVALPAAAATAFVSDLRAQPGETAQVVGRLTPRPATGPPVTVR